jgi:hypothetical protein
VIADSARVTGQPEVMPTDLIRAITCGLPTAVNGRADRLVTFNVRDFGTVPARFGIEVMIPREVIGRMRR